MSLEILKPGLLTTIQDTGRYGYQKQGVMVNGPMDSFALRIANLLVGNDEREGALEITLLGPKIRFAEQMLIAVCGADLSPRIGGQPLPSWRPVLVQAGSVLEFGASAEGCRAYLAVAGSFAVPEVLGSRSTFLRAGIGGYQGRALQAGDVLTLRSSSEQARLRIAQLAGVAGNDPFIATDWAVSRELLPAYRTNPVLRVMRGAQFDEFEPASQAQFWGSAFTVTPQSDRMGYRLQGELLALSEARELLSEAVTAGTIQVPSDGQPIILLADRQTTGGYPKIAQIAAVDLPVIAQVKPGEHVRFQEISVAEAEALYIARERELQLFKQGISMTVI